MKVKLNLLCGTLLLAAGTYLSGCTDKGTTPGVPQVSKGEPIQFSVGTVADAQSRTVYVDDYQLEWNIGDRIKIWCNEPSPKSVDYVVVDTIYSEHGGAITPVGTDTLKWGELNKEYVFYSAYPADRVTDVSNIANGEFGMEYITNQLDTVVSLSNGAYLTNPDMNNAYMLAKQEVTPEASQHHVRLYFDPIMTTFDITVRAGRYEVATGIINPVTVTGVSVIMPKKIDSDKFTYNASNGTTAKDEAIKEETPGFQSVYVGVRNGTSRYVDLHEGETLNLMAFLPPVDMSDGVKMIVHTTAMNYVLSVGGNRIEKQNKYFIQLPDMSPDDSNVNNWMSELDSNTKLNQLSIPAYICSKGDTGEDIARLLAKGVRAFDLNLVRTVGNREYDGKGGYYPCTIENGILGTISGFLNKEENNKEIVVIWVSNSDQDLRLDRAVNGTEGLADKWNNSLSEDYISSSTIQSLYETGKRLIVVKQNTGLYSGYFNNNGEKPWGDGSGYLPRTDLFPYEENVTSIDASRNWWGVYFVTDTNITTSKNLYEYISSYDGQTGCTGIVTIPNAKDTYVNGQYTYSDLLIQSIIDCNFKFRH